MTNEELFGKLKIISDYYINVLHDLTGYQIDSSIGFKAYLKDITQRQADFSKQKNIPISELDKATMTYAKGDPDDPNAIILHECTYTTLKERLKVDGQNENLTRQFCFLIAYEYWEGNIRGKLADTLGIERDSLKADIFGDIRYIRHDILHNRGRATKQNCGKTKILKWFNDGDTIIIDGNKFDMAITKIFEFMNDFIQGQTGQKPYEEKSLSFAGKARQMYYFKDGRKVTVNR